MSKKYLEKITLDIHNERLSSFITSSWTALAFIMPSIVYTSKKVIEKLRNRYIKKGKNVIYYQLYFKSKVCKLVKLHSSIVKSGQRASAPILRK